MKIDPNKMQTVEDAKLALIDQGYENIDDHPVLNRYDADTGKLVENFVIPQEASAPKAERPLTRRELKKIAQVAIAGPRVTINHDGVVLVSDEEIAATRSDDEFAGRY